MKLLLTGATGFVGRNIVAQTLSQWETIYAPVRDAGKLEAQLAAEGIDSEKIVPLPIDAARWQNVKPTHALLSAGVLFARSREEYFTTNVEWNLAILRALPEACRAVVLSSQSAGGPTPEGRSARSESDADTPITWYGESKLALEQAIRNEFPTRPLSILRPPMVLGARDTATLPLFRMGDGFIRIKPGLRPKTYSFIAVDDLVAAILALLHSEPFPVRTFYATSAGSITDLELITGVASYRSNGITVPVPEIFVRVISAIVDCVPALRQKTPSLTRDRAREIWPDRWVVDSSAFRAATGWEPRSSLADALRAAHDFYVREGSLPPPRKTMVRKPS